MKKMMSLVLALVMMIGCAQAVAEEIAEEIVETVIEETVEAEIETIEEIKTEETVIEEIETVETIETETVEIETAALTFSFDTEIRVDANGMSDILTVAAAGTAYEVIEMNGCWTKVACEGIVGYVFNGMAAEQSVNATLTVFSSRKTNVSLNEEIVLSSRLDGVGDAQVSYQWQRDNGNGYEDIEGANGSTYIYNATVENLSCSYRLMVTIAD